MMHPVTVTFTGADGETRGSDVCLIAECARECGVDVEMAILWSANSGRERYPTGVQARELYNRITGEGLCCAVHVCGDRSRKLVDAAQAGTAPTWLTDLWHGGGDGAKWTSLISAIAVRGRLQVNVGPCLDRETLAQIAEGLRQWVDIPIGRPIVIGQHRGGPWPEPHDHVAWLYDQSGGRGVTLDAWPDLPDYLVGLAGGLGPSYSAAEAARRLAAQAGGWVDMESRIRTDGRLDPALCCRVIREVAEAIS